MADVRLAVRAINAAGSERMLLVFKRDSSVSVGSDCLWRDRGQKREWHVDLPHGRRRVRRRPFLIRQKPLAAVLRIVVIPKVVRSRPDEASIGHLATRRNQSPLSPVCRREQQAKRRRKPERATHLDRDKGFSRKQRQRDLGVRIGLDTEGVTWKELRIVLEVPGSVGRHGAHVEYAFRKVEEILSCPDPTSERAVFDLR